VRRGAQRMGVLIDELLELSRVSRVALAPTTVDLSALAQEVVAELAASEPQRQVNVEIAPQLNAWGDEELLRIVLANLIGNAWKYTRRQIAAYIEFSRAAERDEAVFYVRDNGAGFDMKYAAQLFRPFQRLHTDSEFEGTGIGLATVERIIRRHGGRIWADAAPDRGATFQFTLPMGV
jgi:signal transduction histidine kinase